MCCGNAACLFPAAQRLPHQLWRQIRQQVYVKGCIGYSDGLGKIYC